MESELEPTDVTRTTYTAGEYYGNSAWVSNSDKFVDAYRPSFVTFDDGTFYYTENLLSGMGYYTGTFEMDESYGLTCKVENVSFSGYKGENVKEIRFTRYNAWQLQLETDLCGSEAKDRFWNAPSAAGAGSYIMSEDIVKDEWKPAVRFEHDQTFSMKENLYAGMGTYTGVYAYDTNQWICNVRSTNFGHENDHKFIVFHEQEENETIYCCTDVYMARNGTIFNKTDSVDTTTPGAAGYQPSGSTPAPENNGSNGAVGWTPVPSTKSGTVFIVANASSNRIKVRNGPGLSAKDTGERMYNGDRVSVYEETKMDGYTWYRIGDNKWMAGNGTSFGIIYDN